MTRMATAALAALLLIGPALSDAQQDQIRAKLLAKPTWTFEMTRTGGNLHTGKAWFAEHDGKLIGYIEAGFKCDSEVTLRADGFDMETCAPPDKQFVQSGDEFKATFGSYTYTIRPEP
jgi:hypothetical protein